LELQEVKKPVPKDDEVLIKIIATSVTASDALLRRMDQGCCMGCLLQAIFGFGRPRNPIMGMTLSGTVEGVGKKVTEFKAGDPVFAYGSTSAMNRRFGSYAEYICLPEDWNLLPKPPNLTHLQAACVPYGGFLAFHIINRGNVQRGQRVLIYGASGCIGTMAVQLAAHAGATVTAACSGGNAALVESLGAARTIDYTSPDAVAQLEKYDLVLDAVGPTKTSELKAASKKALSPGGKYISIDDDVPSSVRKDFEKLRDMAAEGKLVPVIDRCFPLEEIVQAHEYVDEGHKKGNVAISVTEGADKV